MFMLANDSFNLGGDIKLSNPEMAALIHVTNLACLRAYKIELIDAGMLVVVDSGMHGRGNAGVYRLADLTDGRQMYGNQRAVESKTVVEPVAENVPETTGDLFSEKKTKKRKIAQRRGLEPARSYGDYDIVNLTDTQVSILQKRYPEHWQQYLSKVESYCYRTGKRYRDYAKTIMSWIQKDQRDHPDWFQNQNQPEPEPKQEIKPELLEAAKQIESQTPDIFAEARARREAAWQQ